MTFVGCLRSTKWGSYGSWITWIMHDYGQAFTTYKLVLNHDFLGAIFLMVTSKLPRSSRACCVFVITAAAEILALVLFGTCGRRECIRVDRWRSAFAFIHIQKAAYLSGNIWEIMTSQCWGAVCCPVVTIKSSPRDGGGSRACCLHLELYNRFLAINPALGW